MLCFFLDILQDIDDIIYTQIATRLVFMNNTGKY